MLTRHEFLTGVHQAYQPRSYLEVGINTGRSLTLSRVRSIAVDPAFKITSEIHCDVQVVKSTSDDFFAREDPLAHFPERRVDFGFVDGLHLFEFVLRDFMNVERHADWTSVIVLDDVLPRSVAEASRDRDTMGAWTGDVFKIIEVLREYRPDLLTFALDTDPTGVLVVLGADPDNTTLRDRYDEIVATYVYPDPQQVPEGILRRATATDAASVLQAGFWADLVKARENGVNREAGWADLRRSAESAARAAAPRELTSAMLRPKEARVAANASAGTAPARPAARGGSATKGAKKAGAPPTFRRRAVASARRRLRPLRRRLRGLAGR